MASVFRFGVNPDSRASFASATAPEDATRFVSFYGVEPPVVSPDVKPPTGKHRGCLDGGTEGALPDERTMRTVEGIEHARIGAKVDA